MAQDNLWANGGQILDFNDATVQASVCSFPTDPGEKRYHGQVPLYSQNAQYDENGNLLFFVVDGNMYDREGYLMADNDVDPDNCINCMVKGLQEMLITRMPGSCDKYYVIGGNMADSETAYGYGVLDLSKPNPFFPGRFGALWDQGDVVNNQLLSNQMAATELGITYPIEHLRSVCYLGGSKVPAGMDGNIHLCVLDGPANAEPPTLFIQLARSYKYSSITSQGISDEEVFRDFGIAAADDGMPYSGGLAVSKTASDGILRLARTRNINHYPESSANVSIEISSVTFSGTAPSDVVLAEVNTDLLGTHQGAGTVHGLAFSPNGRYLYFAQATMPYIGYIDMLDPTYAVHDLVAQLGQTPAAMSAYGNGQIACNKGPLPNTWSMYFPKASGFGRLDGIDDAGNVTWTATATPNTGSFSAPPNSILTTAPSPDWNHYLMDRQNYREQQIPNLEQASCCQDNERIPESSHPYTFNGTTTPSNPWTTAQNGLIGLIPCAWPGDGHAYFDHDFVIQAGAKLYVQGMEWRFAPTASLIIEPGAFVKFDNCLLRGGACEPDRWPGVELRGTPLLAQGASTYPPDQGRMVFNNSTLQDAIVGVTAGKKNAWGMVEHAGGILNTRNSTFLNCRVGVNFYPYQNHLPNNSPARNRSNFVSTTFTVDPAYIAPYDFAVHAQFWKVDGIEFLACTFENQRTTETNSSQLGQGIRSLDAHYKVLTLCGDPGPVPSGMCQNVIPSRFNGLDMGIRAATASNGRPFIVEGAVFTDNVCGVYANSVLNFEVHNSNFEVGSSKATDLSTQPDELNWFSQGEWAHRGIYSYRSHGFLVDDNTLTRNASATTNRLEGIVTGYNNGSNDVVFRNHASHLFAGYVGEGTCADQNNTSYKGLWYLCNTNTDNKYGIWSRRDNSPFHDPFPIQTIRLYQGTPNRVADNTFGQVSGQFDVANTNFTPGNSNNPLTYWWALPQVPYWPQYTTVGVSSTNQDANGDPLVRDPDNCASRILPLIPVPPEPGPVELRAYLMNEANSRKSGYGNTRYLYDQLIDGGSTDETVQEIQSTWPDEAWELRAMLLEKSPFLSTDVLKEMALKNIMPPAMVAEICIANPEATRREGFLKWLQYESPCNMPQYLIDNIEASWEQKTYRTTLESTMAFQHSEMTQALNLTLSSYQADTLVEQVDSIRATWQVLRTTGARYAEILTYLQQDNFDSAYAVMDRLPIEFKLKEKEISEKDRTKQYISLVQGYRSNGRTEAELNEGELDALRNLAADTYDRPAEWAQNILCFGYGECRPPRSGGEGEGVPKAMRIATDQQAVETPALSAYPNPAGPWANLVYELKATPENAYLVICDITGKEMARIPVQRAEGQAVWDTREVASGTYTVELMNAGTSAGSVKLMVKR